jgi:hypothetical protein
MLCAELTTSFLFVVAMLASARVLLILASWAVIKINVEFGRHFLTFLAGLDLDDDWEIVSCWQLAIGNESTVFHCEREFGRTGALPSDDAYALLVDLGRLVMIVERCNLHRAIFVDQKLQMGLNLSDNATSIRASNDFTVIMVIVILLLR